MTAKLLIAGFGYILHGVEKRLAVFAAVDSSIEHIVPGDVGIETVRFGLLFELSLERSQLLWILLSQINSLCVVLIQVVELPGVFIKGLVALGVSRDEAAWVGQFCFPPVFVDRSGTKDVVVLLCVMGWGIGVIDRVRQGRSLDGLLLDSADFFRSLDAHKIKRRRQNVDDVTVLGTNPTLVLDALGPIDNERIVSSAFTIRILLPVLERSVCGLRPAERVISIGGSRCADLTNLV